MELIYQRRAVAMIELIFAIVILGIVMMSAPMLISTATKSGYVALQQESIAAAGSEISMILTYHWDENNTDENLSSPILQTTAGDTNLNETTDAGGNGLGVRAGSSSSSTRNFLTSTNERLSASTLGGDGDTDDVDDFIGTSNLSDINTTTTASGDYIDDALVLTTAVDYIGDSPSTGNYLNSDGSIAFNIASDGAGVAGTTNIKKVTLTLTTTNTQSELAKTIILRAFSCNVGTYELEERNY